MPQVPDIPGVVPQVQPFERPVPLPEPQIPQGAFGVGIYDAMQKAGLEGQSAAQEVGSRAIALRQLQIEGKLRDLTTDYYNETAPIREGFLTSQGQNAGPEALQNHLAQL